MYMKIVEHLLLRPRRFLHTLHLGQSTSDDVVSLPLLLCETADDESSALLSLSLLSMVVDSEREIQGRGGRV